jgi:hypothetical protein
MLRYGIAVLALWASFVFMPGASATTDISTLDWQAGIPASGEKAFTIWRKGKQVGFQHLSFERHGDTVKLDIHAEITIKLGFITLFNYVHRNSEVWQAGQLVSLDSETNNDGKFEFARIRRDNQGKLQVVGSHYEGEAPASLLTTSYFIPAFVVQTQLINSQNGSLLAVFPKFIGDETIAGVAGDVSARRYRLAGDLALDIWYDQSGAWQKSAFIPKGHTFRDLDPLTRADVITYRAASPDRLPASEAWQTPRL